MSKWRDFRFNSSLSNNKKYQNRSQYSSKSNQAPLGIDPKFSLSNRFTVFFIIIGIFALLLFGRLIWLQVIDAQNNLDKGSSVGTSVEEISARRGTIYDRNGVVLATTVDAINIFCHPHVVPSDKVETLAQFLVDNCGGDYDDYIEKITSDSNFSYLYKGADESLGQQILDLDIDGLDYEETTKRVYPCGAAGSQIIGILNSEGDAISGLELYYDDILGGQDGERTISYSKEGVPIPGTETVTQEAVAGRDIVVSIDIGLQEYVENKLALRVKEVDGDGGSAVVMDADTGEIYACASDPSFDITDLTDIKEGSTNLSGISTAFEPGSIFKPIVMLAALEEGTTQAGQSYYCPSVLKVDDFTISDSHERASQDMDTSTIIAQSSNVGMSLIASDLGAQNLYDYITKYQVTESTGVDYPGESNGSVTDWSQWSTAQLYNISFGQGIMTTPIEITRFYGVLANGGVMCEPHFLMDVPSEDSPRTYDTTTITENTEAIDEVVSMLEGVVTKGTATEAQISGYTVVGKTGTAEIASSSGGYQKNKYDISFVGFLPDSSLNLVCFVGASNVPGERKTVPAFRDIMNYAIDRYGITQK